MSMLRKPYFHDEEAAHAFPEGVPWPGPRPIRPKCGVFDRAYEITAKPEKKIRVGPWTCGARRKQLAIEVATLFESARKAGADESGEAFETQLKKIAAAKAKGK